MCLLFKYRTVVVQLRHYSVAMATPPLKKVKPNDDLYASPELNTPRSSSHRESADEICNFKKEFKRFKSKQDHLPSDIIDLRRTSTFGNDVITHPCSVDESMIGSKEWQHLGLSKPDTWFKYELKNHPGLFVIPSVLTTSGQYQWADRCLKSYPTKPHKTNIDKFLESEDTGYKIVENPKSLHHLRWVTVGYHHNWNTKIYTEENRSPFPSDLSTLCRVVAGALGYPDFKAEAAIVHYYHHNSTLSGHVDHSERNLEAPLLAFSIGQTGIFLIGGETLDDPTSALFLRSGDLMVMSGPSRRAYHAIPRILKDSCFKQDELGLEEVDMRVLDYLNGNRFNINVRQVN